MHHKLDILADKGYVVLGDFTGPQISPAEWEQLEYLDWKSGGDTNFAPLASATGEMDCRGFWDHGKADKYGIWTANRAIAPSLASYVESIGGNYGRVRVIKLNPSDEATALRQLHLDDNNRLNPDQTGWVIRSWLELDDTPGESVFILRENKDDPATESRIPLHPGMQLVIDTERLWHVVWHPGPRPRYALITSWETDKVVESWIKREMVPAARQAQPARKLAGTVLSGSNRYLAGPASGWHGVSPGKVSCRANQGCGSRRLPAPGERLRRLGRARAGRAGRVLPRAHRPGRSR